MKLQEQWPELFEQLDEAQSRAVVQAFAGSWHEGWEPNYEDVKNLVDETAGVIDQEEYFRRVDAAAERRRRGEGSAS